jgi:hypothetical protein
MRIPAARLLIFTTLAAPAAAQFVNRAVWLGSDDEFVRRDFAQGTEYFLDRFGYVVAPPWQDRGLVRFHDRADIRFGSTSGTQFTVEGRLDQRLDLGDGFAFRYHVLQGENRDARFLRNELALEVATSATTAVFAQGSLFADKSLIDVSLGAWLLREGDDALRVMLTAVDWTADKSRLVEYVEAPYAAMVSGAFGDVAGHRVAFELGGQLPFEQRDRDDGDTFELQRWIGTAESHLRLAERDVLVAAVEAEWTEKQLTPAGLTDPRREAFDRAFVQWRAEWWRDVELPWSVGVLHTWHREDGRRPLDPATELRTRREEWFGIFRLRWQAGAKLAFEPQLFAGFVRDAFRDGVETRDEDRFEGKINWNARWDFSPNVALTLIVGTQLDELAFGGGGAQFVARF